MLWSMYTGQEEEFSILEVKWTKDKFIEAKDAVNIAGWLPDDQGEPTLKKNKSLRREMPQAQRDDFLMSRERWRWALGHVCFYSPERGESHDTPADLLTGWEKRGLLIHLLVVYRALESLGEVSSAPHSRDSTDSLCRSANSGNMNFRKEREQEKWCWKIQDENTVLSVQPTVSDAVNMSRG